MMNGLRHLRRSVDCAPVKSVESDGLFHRFSAGIGIYLMQVNKQTYCESEFASKL